MGSCSSVTLICIVLFSAVHNIWQLSDVDHAQEGSSSRATQSTRSHSGPLNRDIIYDPPEVIGNEKNSKVNQSVDIWSLGLIIYELIRRKHLFRRPFQVVRYVKEEELRSLVRDTFHLDRYLGPVREWRKDDIKGTILQTVAVSPSDRPFATALKGAFNEMVSAQAFPNSCPEDSVTDALLRTKFGI